MSGIKIKFNIYLESITDFLKILLTDLQSHKHRKCRIIFEIPLRLVYISTSGNVLKNICQRYFRATNADIFRIYSEGRRITE